MKVQKHGAQRSLFYPSTHLYSHDEGRPARVEPTTQYPGSPEARQPMYPRSPEVSRSPAVDGCPALGNTTTPGMSESQHHTNPKQTHPSTTVRPSRIGDAQYSHLQQDPALSPIAIHSSNPHTSARGTGPSTQPPLAWGSTKHLSTLRPCPTSLSPVLRSCSLSHKGRAGDAMHLPSTTEENAAYMWAGCPKARNAFSSVSPAQKAYSPTLQWRNMFGLASPTQTASNPISQTRNAFGQASPTQTANNPTSQTRNTFGQASPKQTANSPTSPTRNTFGMASPTLTAYSPTSRTRNTFGMASPTLTAYSPTSRTRSTFCLTSPTLSAFSLTAPVQNAYSPVPEVRNASSPVAQARNVFSPLVQGRSDMSALVMQLRLQVATMQQRQTDLEAVNHQLQQALVRQTNTNRMTTGKLKIMETAWHHGDGSFSTGALAASMKELDVVNRTNMELKDANVTLYNALRLAMKERDGDKGKSEEAAEENAKLQAELNTMAARGGELEEERRLLRSRCQRHDILLEQWQDQLPRPEAKSCQTANASTQVNNFADNRLHADNKELREKLLHMEEQLDIKYSRILEGIEPPVNNRIESTVGKDIEPTVEKRIESPTDNAENDYLNIFIQ